MNTSETHNTVHSKPMSDAWDTALKTKIFYIKEKNTEKEKYSFKEEYFTNFEFIEEFEEKKFNEHKHYGNITISGWVLYDPNTDQYVVIDGIMPSTYRSGVPPRSYEGRLVLNMRYSSTPVVNALNAETLVKKILRDCAVISNGSDTPLTTQDMIKWVIAPIDCGLMGEIKSGAKPDFLSDYSVYINVAQHWIGQK